MDLCKVRYDGFNFLGMPYRNKTKIKTEEIIDKTEFVDKKKYFVNDWAKINFPYSSNGRKFKTDVIKEFEKELLKYYILLINDKKNKRNELVEFLKDIISSDYDLLLKYLSCKFSFEDIDIYVKKFVERQKENLKSRKSLFKRKALSNDWNYFCTFTYDDKKHTELSFVKTLKKKLQNLHTNYGWLYMGCFERGDKTNRLHFHCLLYVPYMSMKGELIEERYYNSNTHSMNICYINTEFLNKIGRNDFKPISKNDLTFNNSYTYIYKYIEKNNERVVYSRGIKDDIYCMIDFEENALFKINKLGCWYILSNDCMKIELDRKLNKISAY